MLKIVPDPPLHRTLEDALIQASEYAMCAQAVTHQALQIQTKSPTSALLLASLHELEALRSVLESALVQVQFVTSPHTQH